MLPQLEPSRDSAVESPELSQPKKRSKLFEFMDKTIPPEAQTGGDTVLLQVDEYLTSPTLNEEEDHGRGSPYFIHMCGVVVASLAQSLGS